MATYGSRFMALEVNVKLWGLIATNAVEKAECYLAAKPAGSKRNSLREGEVEEAYLLFSRFNCIADVLVQKPPKKLNPSFWP